MQLRPLSLSGGDICPANDYSGKQCYRKKPYYPMPVAELCKKLSLIHILSRSFERHFNERPFLNHTCYLFLTKTTKERSRTQSNFNTLCRGFIIPKEIQDKDVYKRQGLHRWLRRGSSKFITQNVGFTLSLIHIQMCIRDRHIGTWRSVSQVGFICLIVKMIKHMC